MKITIPHRWLQGRIEQRVCRPLSRYRRPVGHNLAKDDWDTLIILDGCRADAFEAVAPLETFDAYRRINSVATSTQEWVTRTWSEDALKTTYVSASPVIETQPRGIIGDVRNVWIDHWHDGKTNGTVYPQHVTRAALRASLETSNRMVVHYLQPHYPFLFADFDLPESEAYYHAWGAVRAGVISPRECWDAYLKNLRLVLADAIYLARKLPGRTVISSDHGNCMGETLPWLPVKLYSHPSDVWIEELYEVPYAVVGDLGSDENSTTSVSERLKALGYA